MLADKKCSHYITIYYFGFDTNTKIFGPLRPTLYVLVPVLFSVFFLLPKLVYIWSSLLQLTHGSRDLSQAEGRITVR